MRRPTAAAAAMAVAVAAAAGFIPGVPAVHADSSTATRPVSPPATLPAVWAPPAPAPPESLGNLVREALTNGCQFLLARQNTDGTWGAGVEQQDILTPLAAYTLIHADVSPRNPSVEKALAWLAGSTARSGRSHALRGLAYIVANCSTDNKYERLEQKDLNAIVHSLPVPPRMPDLPDLAWSSLAFTPGGWRGNPEISTAHLCRTIEFWRRSQKTDGSWSIDGMEDLASTAAGLRSLHVLYHRVHMMSVSLSHRPPPLPEVQRAEQWLHRNLRDLLARPAPPERRAATIFWLAMLCQENGQWLIEGLNVPRLAARELLRLQNRDGSWGGPAPEQAVTATAHAVAALRALYGYGVNLTHLRYEGDWNNRPIALRNLIRRLSYYF